MSRTRKHKVDDAGRECSQCDEYQPWSEFLAGANRKGGDTRCKTCLRKKGSARNARPDVQESEHQRWLERKQQPAQWRAAHPGEFYDSKEVRVARFAPKRARQFGVTKEQIRYLVKVALFGEGLCDLHGGPETMKYARYGGSEVRSLSVDHDHDCDRGHPPEKGCRYCIRGLLCCDCNRNIIRRAEQHPEIAKRFADYLARRPLLDPAAPQEVAAS